MLTSRCASPRPSRYDHTTCYALAMMASEPLSAIAVLRHGQLKLARHRLLDKVQMLEDGPTRASLENSGSFAVLPMNSVTKVEVLAGFCAGPGSLGARMLRVCDFTFDAVDQTAARWGKPLTAIGWCARATPRAQGCVW